VGYTPLKAKLLEHFRICLHVSNICYVKNFEWFKNVEKEKNKCSRNSHQHGKHGEPRKRQQGFLCRQSIKRAQSCFYIMPSAESGSDRRVSLYSQFSTCGPGHIRSSDWHKIIKHFNFFNHGYWNTRFIVNKWLLILNYYSCYVVAIIGAKNVATAEEGVQVQLCFGHNPFDPKVDVAGMWHRKVAVDADTVSVIVHVPVG